MEAAKDVSMAGLIGSLAILLESNRLGVCLDLDALPVPAGVTVERWVTCFPCLSFLLCVPPERRRIACMRSASVVWRRPRSARWTRRALLRIGSAGQATETVCELSRESVTNLARPSGR